MKIIGIHIDQLPDAYVLTRRHINGEAGSIVLAISPLARQVMQKQCVTMCDQISVAIFVPMAYCSQVLSFLESEGLELSEL